MEKAGELLPDGLDYLICNAGVVGDHVRASEESSESVERVWRINFMGFLLSVQTALPLLRKGNAKTVLRPPSPPVCLPLSQPLQPSSPLPSPLILDRYTYEGGRGIPSAAVRRLPKRLPA